MCSKTRVPSSLRVLLSHQSSPPFLWGQQCSCIWVSRTNISQSVVRHNNSVKHFYGQLSPVLDFAKKFLLLRHHSSIRPVCNLHRMECKEVWSLARNICGMIPHTTAEVPGKIKSIFLQKMLFMLGGKSSACTYFKKKRLGRAHKIGKEQ